MAAPTKSPPGPSTIPGRPPARTRTEREGLSPDQFQEVSSKVVDLVVAWRIPIAAGVIGVFVAAAGYSIWTNHLNRRNEQGAAEIAKVNATLPDSGETLSQLGINLDDVARSPEEVKERNEKLATAAASLEKVAQEYSNVTSGRIAMLERAQLLAQAAKLDEAANAYRAALEKNLEEPVFKFRALSGLGNVLRSQEKYGDATQQYQRISNELEGVWKQQGMLELGRTYELQKDYADAAKTYEELLKQFPDIAEASEVQARLAVAKAGGPAAPPAPSASESVGGTGGAAAPAASTGAESGAAPAVPVPAAAPGGGAPAAPGGGAPVDQKGGHE